MLEDLEWLEDEATIQQKTGSIHLLIQLIGLVYSAIWTSWLKTGNFGQSTTYDQILKYSGHHDLD